jgi:hypothetical protein
MSPLWRRSSPVYRKLIVASHGTHGCKRFEKVGRIKEETGAAIQLS